MGERTTTRAGSQGPTRREDWLGDGLLSGFIATFAMTVVLAAAFGLASIAGDPAGGGLARWFWALAHNPVTQQTANLVVLAIALNLMRGLVLAIVYARYVEPAFTGPGWSKGVAFALVPWVLSLIFFLPLMGGGFLGLGIGAGPLPVLGNLILHLVYGAVLGGVYAIALEEDLENPAVEREHAAAAQLGAAVGVVGGLVLGALAGWVLAPQLAEETEQAVIVLAGALIGGASGVVAGSFLGMGTVRHSP